MPTTLLRIFLRNVSHIMPHIMRRIWRIVGVAGAIFSVIASVGAQPTFPDKPITVIVPYAAGGPTDKHVRTVAEEASKILGQAVLIENKPGANGTLAALALTRAKADGYTLGILPATVYREPYISRVSYDARTNFTYLMLMSASTFGLAVGTQGPWKTWQDLVTDARTRPGKITVGISGALGSPRIFMDEWALEHGIELNVVPYKSDVDVATALLGGHVDIAPLSGIAVPHIQAGKMRYLLMLTQKRVEQFPEITATGELIPPAWIAAPYGLAAPRDLEAGRVQILHEAFKQALFSQASQDMMNRLNQQAYYMGPQDYKNYALKSLDLEQDRVKRLREKKLID